MLTITELCLLREYLGLKLIDIAMIMGVTAQTISNIEIGSRKNKRTILFYEETLLKLLKEQTGKTYAEYLERKILMYTNFLDSHKKQSL